MKYSVVSIKNNQYKFVEGEEVLIDKIDEKELEANVMLVVDGDKVHIGQPYLKKAKIELDYVGEEKGDKLHVRKFKAKSRYRRKIGFRPVYSRIKVNKISV